MKLFNHIKGNISGALSAAVITLPISIGYGMLVYAPLGVALAPQGALIEKISTIKKRKSLGCGQKGHSARAWRIEQGIAEMNVQEN